jgi:hypothetical protein
MWGWKVAAGAKEIILQPSISTMGSLNCGRQISGVKFVELQSKGDSGSKQGAGISRIPSEV